MKTNYLTRHYRGELSLAKAFWLTGLWGIPLVIVLWAMEGGMRAFAATTTSQDAGLKIIYDGLAILIFPAGAILYTMWWSVGTLRCARNAKKRVWANLARAWIIIGLAWTTWDYLQGAVFSFVELSKGHVVASVEAINPETPETQAAQEAPEAPEAQEPQETPAETQEAPAETTPTPSLVYPEESIGGPIPPPYPATQQSLPSEVAGGQTVHMIGIKVALPVGQSGETLALRDYVSVSVDRNGNPYFDKTEMGYDQLTATLQKVHDENPEAAIFIRGDADTVHGNIIRVLDILRSVGFYKVAFEIKSEAAKTLSTSKGIIGIKVALPSAVVLPSTTQKDFLLIQVREGNTVYFDGQYVADDEILPRLYRLHEANPNIKVSISATMLALHGDVITVLDKVRRARIEKVGYQIRAAKPGGAATAAGNPPPPPLRPIETNKQPDTFDALRPEIFVKDFVKALASNDLETQLLHYGDRVNYYEFGQVAKEVISKDLKHDIATWPSRIYSITASPKITADGSGLIAEFPMAYTLRSSTGTRSGVLEMAVWLKPQAETWHVVAIQKRVIGARGKVGGDAQEVRNKSRTAPDSEYAQAPSRSALASVASSDATATSEPSASESAGKEPSPRTEWKPSTELCSANHEYCVKIAAEAQDLDHRKLIVSSKARVLAQFPTFGYLMDAFWSPDNKYVAINNRRANAGDYLWVISLSDGAALKMPDDLATEMGKKNLGHINGDDPWGKTVHEVTTRFTECAHDRLDHNFLFARGWKGASDLLVLEELQFSNEPPQSATMTAPGPDGKVVTRSVTVGYYGPAAPGIWIAVNKACRVTGNKIALKGETIEKHEHSSEFVNRAWTYGSFWMQSPAEDFFNSAQAKNANSPVYYGHHVRGKVSSDEWERILTKFDASRRGPDENWMKAEAEVERVRNLPSN